MNWKRGLWRLWIAMSCAWMMLAIFTLNPLSQFAQIFMPVVFSYGDLQLRFSAYTDAEFIKRELARAIEKEREKEPSGTWRTGEKDPQSTATQIVSGYRPKSLWKPLRIFAQILLLPPALLLLVGLGVIWVIQGFRDSAISNPAGTLPKDLASPGAKDRRANLNEAPRSQAPPTH